MIAGSWKLLTLEGQPVELFNIREDPYERNNLLDKHPDRAGDMARKVRDVAGRAPAVMGELIGVRQWASWENGKWCLDSCW